MSIDNYITMALKKDYSFILSIDSYDINSIFERLKQLPNKEEATDAVFLAIKEIFPIHAFHLVYKIEKYKDFICSYLMNNTNFTFAILKDFEDLLITKTWFYEFLKEHLNLLPSLGVQNISLFFSCAYQKKDLDLVKKLVNHANVLVRSSVLLFVFESSLRSSLKDLYPGNLTEYFVIRDENGAILDKLPEEVISRCATYLFDYIFPENLYLEIMNFVLENYPDNHLLSYLLEEYDDDNFDHRKEFLESHFTILYDSSCGAQLDIYSQFPYLLDEDRLNKIESFLQMIGPNEYEFVYAVFRKGLGNKILTWFFKYLKLSRNKNIKFLNKGTCSFSYKVGDYVLKISDKKYSREEIICPRNYLVIKPYEEYYQRIDLGVVTGAVEVLHPAYKPLTEKDRWLVEIYCNAFRSLGYTLFDVDVYNDCSNLYFLKDYHEADCEDPESLPDWFKKNPVVLVDRDLVKKIEEKPTLQKRSFPRNNF